MIPLALVGCAVPEAVEVAAVRANPLSTIERDIDRTPFAGEADEVRAAGGYEYVHVADRWVVGLSKGIAVGDALTVKPIGRARDFVSHRTGDRYDELLFAVLAPNVTP